MHSLSCPKLMPVNCTAAPNTLPSLKRWFTLSQGVLIIRQSFMNVITMLTFKKLFNCYMCMKGKEMYKVYGDIHNTIIVQCNKTAQNSVLSNNNTSIRWVSLTKSGWPLSDSELLAYIVVFLWEPFSDFDCSMAKLAAQLFYGCGIAVCSILSERSFSVNSATSITHSFLLTFPSDFCHRQIFTNEMKGTTCLPPMCLRQTNEKILF